MGMAIMPRLTEEQKQMAYQLLDEIYYKIESDDTTLHVEISGEISHWERSHKKKATFQWKEPLAPLEHEHEWNGIYPRD
jgi:hypothetical protein